MIRIPRIPNTHIAFSIVLGFGTSYYLWKPYIDEQEKKREEKRAAYRARIEANKASVPPALSSSVLPDTLNATTVSE